MLFSPDEVGDSLEIDPYKWQCLLKNALYENA